MTSLMPRSNDDHLRDLAARGQLEPLLDLLDQVPAGGLNLDSRDDLGCTALLLAAAENHPNVVQALIDANASVTVAALDGDTALHAAAQQGHHRVVDLLLHAGADVNAVNADGATPLHLAAWNANADTVERLVKAGADANRRDGDGDTPWAVARMRDVVIRGSDRPRTLALLDAAMDPAVREAEVLRRESAGPTAATARPGF